MGGDTGPADPPPPRTLVVVCADWPVVATGRSLDDPVAVVVANRVVATSPGARAHGVVRGLRRRQAQGRCPDLVVVERDPEREVRLFEPVVAALDRITPRVEIRRPGVCAFTTRGPARYFGGDEAVARLTHETALEAVEGRTGVRVGVADGAFAAGWAARLARPVRLVEPGGSAAFLAPLPVGAVGRPDLVDVLVRLGLRTLGDLAALPAADVLARFGTEGRTAHRLAAGLDDRPPDARIPPPDWSVATELDPPADRVDRAAFAARRLADELHERLGREGLACVSVGIEAETEHGEVLVRHWRHEGALTAAAVADRVRWQLDAWLHAPAASRPSGALVRLALVPDEVVPARGRQLGFWGGESAGDERAARVAARLEGQFGVGAVLVPERRGGREPHDAVELVPAAAVELRGRSAVSPIGPGGGPGPEGAPPWPGSLPTPSPTRVLAEPVAVEVLDAGGAPVGVTGRGEISAEPALVVVDGRRSAIVAWAGPWPVDERWWDPGRHRRRARLQVLTDDGVLRLVALEGGRWWSTAVWD